MPAIQSELQTLDPTVLAAAFAVVGLLYAFAGYLLLRFLVGLTGFVIAGTVSAVLVQFAVPGEPLVMLGAGLLGGLCGAFAMVFLIRMAIFLIGGAAVFLLAQPFFADRPEVWAPWAPVGIGLIGGILAVALERPILILATTILGGRLVVHGAVLLILGPSSAQYLELNGTALPADWFVLGAWGAVSLLGMILQFATTRTRRR
jgi:hypothetical protein